MPRLKNIMLLVFFIAVAKARISKKSPAAFFWYEATNELKFRSLSPEPFHFQVGDLESSSLSAEAETAEALEMPQLIF